MSYIELTGYAGGGETVRKPKILRNIANRKKNY